MRKKTGILAFFFLALALILGAGCTEKGAPLPSSVKKPPPKAAEPLPLKEDEKVEREAYQYDRKGRRDPFASLIEIAKAKPVRKKGATPIETYDVDEIKLSAIVWDSRQYYALIILPDNKSYTIKRGMTLGLYGGKVENITRDSVLIREQRRDYKGQLKTKDTILRLRKEGEG